MMTLFDEEMVMSNHDKSVERKARDAGRAEGQQDTKVADLKNIMESFGVNIDRAMDSLKIPQDQRTMYAGLVQNSQIFNDAS